MDDARALDYVDPVAEAAAAAYRGARPGVAAPSEVVGAAVAAGIREAARRGELGPEAQD